MNSSSLLALIVDQQSGELAPEVHELLEAHLAQNSQLRAEAERTRKALTITEEAVLRYPDLGRASTRESVEVPPRRRVTSAWLAKAASIALIATVTGAGGFLIGRQGQTAATYTTNVELERPPRKDSPWAQYRLTQQRGSGGMQIVRVDVVNSKQRTLQ